MSSNAEAPKMAIMGRPNIVNSIIHHLGNENAKVRVAATWCLINWTWANSEDETEGKKNTRECLFCVLTLE